MKKGFRYKTQKGRRESTPGNNIQVYKSPDEGFTGAILGKPASDIEERSARALDKLVEKSVLFYDFRVPVLAQKNMPGWKELDFVVTTYFGVQPFEIDGEIAHKGIQQKEEDRIKDMLIDEIMKGRQLPIIRVPGEELKTQERADRYFSQILR